MSSPPGGAETGSNPTDRGKLGSKRHIIVDALGVPLAIAVSIERRLDIHIAGLSLPAATICSQFVDDLC